MDRVWQFRTARFTVALDIDYDPSYRYDGDDTNGEVQTALDRGDYVAFDSRVSVYLDGVCIGAETLSGSVYAAGEVSDFWQAHRDADPLNRNCTIMRAVRGERTSICHYFPTLVAEAIRAARMFLSCNPRVRAAA